jgi:hypothetical protein
MIGIRRVATLDFSRLLASHPSISGRLKVRPLGACGFDPLSAGCGDDNRVTDVHKTARQHVAIHLIVFDEKDAGHLLDHAIAFNLDAAPTC